MKYHELSRHIIIAWVLLKGGENALCDNDVRYGKCHHSRKWARQYMFSMGIDLSTVLCITYYDNIVYKSRTLYSHKLVHVRNPVCSWFDSRLNCLTESKTYIYTLFLLLKEKANTYTTHRWTYSSKSEHFERSSNSCMCKMRMINWRLRWGTYTCTLFEGGTQAITET